MSASSGVSAAVAAAAAICLCGCFLCATAAPAAAPAAVAPASEPAAELTVEPSAPTLVTDRTEDTAVKYLHKTFYDNAVETEDGKLVTDLIRTELRRSSFKFESIADRAKEDWEYIVRSLFMSYYLKQKSMSERVTHLLYKSLGLEEQTNRTAVEAEDYAALIREVPPAVLNLVEKWNNRPPTRKFEDSIFIGASRTLSDRDKTTFAAWAFTLSRPMASKRILRMNLRIHLTQESREALTGQWLEVSRVVETESGTAYNRLGSTRIPVKVKPLALEPTEGIQVDVTEIIKPTVHGSVQRGAEELELMFAVTCPKCKASLHADVTYMVMECKVRVVNNYLVGGDELLSRETREVQPLQWPFDNNTTTEVFKNQNPGASFTKSQMCIIENVNRRYGQKSCCLMEFTYDMAHQGLVLAPKQLKISYCAGECHSQSQVHTPHSSFLQIVGHSQSSKLSHETKEDINLCCVANTYRDFQVLTISRPTGNSTKSSVELKVIKDISAESCTCA